MKYLVVPILLVILSGCTYVDTKVDTLNLTITVGELNGVKLQGEEMEVH